jgi:hypothetical protein
MAQQPRTAVLPAVGLSRRAVSLHKSTRRANTTAPGSGRGSLQTVAGAMWSMDVKGGGTAQTLPKLVAQRLCSQTLPIDLTGIIAKNQKCVVGAVEGAGVDVVLDVKTVSGTHAQFEVEEGDTGDLFITDLSSTNGTFVNGKELTGGEKMKLSTGDSVCFGLEPDFVVMRTD